MVPTEVEAVSTRDAPGGPGLVMASFFGKGRQTCNSLGAGTTSEAGGPPGANRKPNSEGKVAKHNSVSNSSFPHNLSRGREVKTLPIKLGVYNTRPLGIRVSERGKTGVRHKSCPTFSSKSIEVLQGNCRSRSHGNPGSETKKCSSNVKHCFSRFCKHNFSSSKEGRGHTSYHKSKRTESAFGLRTLQNGGHSFTSRPLNSKRFSGENRSQRRLPHCSYLGKSPEISQVSMGARNSGIQFPSIRCLRSSTHLHKTHENSNGASSSSGLQINCLPRRHPINESISRRFEKRSRSDNSYPNKSGFHYKLQEVCIRPLPLPRVSGFSSKFARNDTQSSTTQNQRHKKHLSKMSQSDGRISAPDIRGNRKTFGLSEGHIPGTTTLSFSSNVENKRSHSPAKLRVSRYTGFGIKGRITVVDKKHRALERKNDNSSFPRIHHRVGRERLGLGCSMPRGQNRGSLARSGDFSPHKCKRIVGSISGREIVFERKRKHSCPHKNGQHNNCSTYKETRRNRFQTMRLHHPRSLAMVFRSENFPSSRISTRGRERGCRLGKSSHARQSSWMLDRNIFLLINATFGPLNVDLFADRTNNQLDVYMSWFPDPGAVATNAFLHPWMGKNAYAFPPFCLIGQCIAKLRAEKCEIVLVTPGWQTQAWYPHLMSMSIQNPLLLPTTDNLLTSPIEGVHPLVSNGTLTLIAWKLSGDVSKQLAFQKTLKTFYLDHAEMVRTGLTKVPGTNGSAGVVNGKLLPFQHPCHNF